ncbi:MAG TPA: hydrogenase nickel incorporation protein HypB [Tepidisphaeraceae bacterium]|jgi:hydrogenase nickel incorporation protein HypB
MSTPRLVEVRQKILKQNDVTARALRQRFHDAGIFVISLVSSPGAGKTAFLERVLTLAAKNYRVAALVGDLATDNDAARLSRSGAPVKQITTGTVCHLEAQMIHDAIEGWFPLENPFSSQESRAIPGPQLPVSPEILFIENVGNLVCPSSYDLGEDLRLVLLSVTEGEDKPLKYPTIFNTADVAVITKMDLADAVGFDRAAAYHSIHSVRPGMTILEVSAKSDAGLDSWQRFFTQRLDQWRMRCASPIST